MYTSLIATLLLFLIQNGQEFYQQALVQERAAGNLEAAIQLYQDAARYAGNDRALAAQAMLSAARCYEKLGQARARTLYEEIALTYADQPQYAAQAMDRARALQSRDTHTVLQMEEAKLANLAIGQAKAQASLLQVAPGMYWSSTTPQFDSSRPIVVAGTVTQVDFSNPSISISIASTPPGGSPVVYTVKGGPPKSAVQNGLTKTTIRIGDPVTVEGLLAKEPDTRIIGAATLTLSDGRRIPLGQSVSGKD